MRCNAARDGNGRAKPSCLQDHTEHYSESLLITTFQFILWFIVTSLITRTEVLEMLKMASPRGHARCQKQTSIRATWGRRRVINRKVFHIGYL